MPEASAPSADGLAGALSAIKQGEFKLRKASDGPPTNAKVKPAGGGGADDLFAEMKAKPIKLRATGGRTASGKFQPQAAGSERNGDVQVGLPGVRALRRPKPKPEPPKELSELEKVR